MSVLECGGVIWIWTSQPKGKKEVGHCCDYVWFSASVLIIDTMLVQSVWSKYRNNDTLTQREKKQHGNSVC